MRNILVITVCLICASVSSNAQIIYHPILDTLQKCPFLYGYYNWDDIPENLENGCFTADCMFPFTSITSRFTSTSDLYSFRANIGEIAFYQHSDSVLHAIGIAVKPPFVRTTHGHFFLGLYDSTLALQRGLTPAHYFDQEVDLPPNLYYRVHIPGRPDNPYYGIARPLMFSFFDEPIDISGDFYLSIGEEIEPHSPAGLNEVHTWKEFHDPPFHIGNHNIKWYQKDIKSWVDDTLLNAIPQLFLIIEPECHTLDSINVTTDSLGHVTVEWDTLKWQRQWVLRLVGPGGTRYDTVETNSFTYFNLDTNAHYELCIQTQCYLPGGRHNLSSWSNPVTIGHGVAAIEDFSIFNSQFSIHPNPASRQVVISATLPMTHIEATDILGHRLFDRPASGLTSTLDVSSWPAGTYLLRITTPSGVATKKLLVK